MNIADKRPGDTDADASRRVIAALTMALRGLCSSLPQCCSCSNIATFTSMDDQGDPVPTCHTHKHPANLLGRDGPFQRTYARSYEQAVELLAELQSGVAAVPMPNGRCSVCNHPPCPGCRDWCDVLVIDEYGDNIECCHGKCTYPEDANS